MDRSFHPCSRFPTPGNATTCTVRGRLEFSDRQGTLKFTARFDNNSAELTKLKAQTTGTAVITLPSDTNNSLQITWQKVVFATAEVGEMDQLVTVAVEATPVYDCTNGEDVDAAPLAEIPTEEAPEIDALDAAFAEAREASS